MENETNETTEKWTVEQYDHAWGGWRRCKASWVNDTDCEFPSEKEAQKFVHNLKDAYRTKTSYRVRKIETPKEG